MDYGLTHDLSPILDVDAPCRFARETAALGRSERRILPPMQRIERREQMAAIGKDFKQWADDYFAPGSGNLDCELKADKVLNDFNQETKFGWSAKRFKQHLKDYCQLAEHISCLNPAGITGRDNDGERWVRRDENGVQKPYYYLMTVKSAIEAERKEPQQQELPL